MPLWKRDDFIINACINKDWKILGWMMLRVIHGSTGIFLILDTGTDCPPILLLDRSIVNVKKKLQINKT